MSSSATRHFTGILGKRIGAGASVIAADDDSIVLGTALTQDVRSTSAASQDILENAQDFPALSDETLLSCICNGEKEALACLFRRYARLVRSVAYKVIRDTFEAEDMVQEVFLLVHRKCRSFDSSKGTARSWILQITYSRAISRRRYLSHRQFYTCIDLDDAEPQLQDPRSDRDRLEHLIDTAGAAQGVVKLFETLSANQRQTLRLHFFQGRTFDEIASELGQTRENVRHHYFRGLHKLRKQFFATQSGR